MSHDFPDFSIFYFCFIPFYIALAIYFLTKIPKVGKKFFKHINPKALPSDTPASASVLVYQKA